MSAISDSSLQVIDSHTGGEPTRVVVEGAPTLTGGGLAQQRDTLERDHDWIRTACIAEPRGFEAVVGALLCESDRDDCVAGVIFFNNVGYLGGCIHGTIGVVETLRYLGRIGVGEYGIETPVGVVRAQVDEGGRISVRNVRSYRAKKSVRLELPGHGVVTGDVAWGGNWFFLVRERPEMAVELNNIQALTDFCWAVREAFTRDGITGDDGGEIDHVELFAAPADPTRADSKNFVLCPGKAYDRSPCGTGTSAKLACLFADGQLEAGKRWRQAGILDTVFEGSVEPAAEGGVIPTLSGSAHVTARSELILSSRDPFRLGIVT